MKRALLLAVVSAIALLAAHAAPAHAYGDATCGTNDSGGNTSTAVATGFYHGDQWHMSYGFDNCGTGSTVQLVIARSSNGGSSWTNIWDFDHVITSGESGPPCDISPCFNNAATSAIGCSNTYIYRLTVNTYNQQDRMRWSPSGC